LGVGINQKYANASHGKRGRDINGNRGLANATLSIEHADDHWRQRAKWIAAVPNLTTTDSVGQPKSAR
jgi:hypothetical protein